MCACVCSFANYKKQKNSKRTTKKVERLEKQKDILKNIKVITCKIWVCVVSTLDYVITLGAPVGFLQTVLYTLVAVKYKMVKFHH